jgi:hypothetical protein
MHRILIIVSAVVLLVFLIFGLGGCGKKAEPVSKIVEIIDVVDGCVIKKISLAHVAQPIFLAKCTDTATTTYNAKGNNNPNYTVATVTINSEKVTE